MGVVAQWVEQGSNTFRHFKKDETMQSTIRLFKALPIEAKTGRKKKVSKALLEKTIRHGFVFSQEVVNSYSADALDKIVSKIGLSPEQINSSFHKSWKKVKDADIQILIIEQIVHYITTYGFEGLRIYDKSTVFVPEEALTIPEIDTKQMPLAVINGYTKIELKQKILQMLDSGMALQDTTKNDVIEVALYVGISEVEVENIKNKEARVALFDYFNMVPENPTEFLRYLVYKTTNKTLLIKNKSMIADIKSKDNLCALKLLTKYEKQFGLGRLAEIFYRFKPIFLAFRTNRNLKTIINRIRKLAVSCHKPMPEDFLNTVTAKIKNGKPVYKKTLKVELDKANIFRKIRLAYALKFRETDCDSILYRIRNGKSYSADFKFDKYEKATEILNIVLQSIADTIPVKGKKIYIPSEIKYSLPATEKMFTGQFPSGTCVVIPKDMVFGVHWNNVLGSRVDLDLSLICINNGKIGWDAKYRSGDGSVLFSGDITDAAPPNGASELFFVQKQSCDIALLFVNFYNYQEGLTVPIDIIIAKELVKDFRKNYMLNPNNIVASATTQINERQKILGLMVTDYKECRFYFTETYLGQSITSGEDDNVVRARKFLTHYYQNTVQLNDVLLMAGAKIVTKRDGCDIDLSPEALEKDTFIRLLQCGE
jgi:hypothetical protein